MRSLARFLNPSKNVYMYSSFMYIIFLSWFFYLHVALHEFKVPMSSSYLDLMPVLRKLFMYPTPILRRFLGPTPMLKRTFLSLTPMLKRTFLCLLREY
jgi:hypothetical protein